MIDPISAIAIAASAVSNIKTLMAAGHDATEHLAKFAGAVSDINYAAEKAKNPSILKSLSGSAEKEAIEIFAAQKKLQALRREIETLIAFNYGPKGLEEYKNILRGVREQRKRTEYRRQEVKENVITTVVVVLLCSSIAALVAGITYFVGKNMGKW